jgi:hypothetical protein
MVVQYGVAVMDDRHQIRRQIHPAKKGRAQSRPTEEQRKEHEAGDPQNS